MSGIGSYDTKEKRKSSASSVSADEESSGRVETRSNTHSLSLLVKFSDELGPVLETDLENFPLLDLRDLDEVEMSVEEEFLVLVVLDELEMLS